MKMDSSDIGDLAVGIVCVIIAIGLFLLSYFEVV